MYIHIYMYMFIFIYLCQSGNNNNNYITNYLLKQNATLFYKNIY